MSQTLHMLRGIVTGDVSKFERMMRRGIKVTKELAGAWGNAGRAIGSSAARVGTAVTAVGAVSVRTFAKFEETMVRVGGVTRTLGNRDFKTLEDAAKQAGETTRFSATQSASAMEALGLAGLKTGEIIKALPGSLQLASAAQVDIATAANVAAKTMRAFGLEAEDLSRINDTLVATFTASNTDLLQLAEAIKPVGPVAKTMGVSLEDTTAILAKMADAGFQGSLGGTALRAAFIRLAAPSAAAKKILQELGVDAAEPLFDKFRKIEAAIRGATSETEALAIAAELFGARGGPAMLAVLDSGVESLEDFSAMLDESTGLAKELEQAGLNTLGGQFDILKSSIEGVVLTAGGELNPTLRELIANLQAFIAENRADLVNQFAGALQAVAQIGANVVKFLHDSGPALMQMSQQFGRWLSILLEFLAQHPRLVSMLALLKVSSLLGITQAVGALGGAFMATGKQMASFVAHTLRGVTGMASLRAAMTSTVGGVSLLTLGIAALAAGMVFAWDKMGMFGAKAEGLAESQALMNKQIERGISLIHKQAQEARDAAAALGDLSVAQLENEVARLEKEQKAADALALATLRDQQKQEEKERGTVKGNFNRVGAAISGAIGGSGKLKSDGLREHAEAANKVADAVAEELELTRKALKETRQRDAEKFAKEQQGAGQFSVPPAVLPPGGGGQMPADAQGQAERIGQAVAKGLTDEQKLRLGQGRGTAEDRAALNSAVADARAALAQEKADAEVQKMIDDRTGVTAASEREQRDADAKQRTGTANAEGMEFTQSAKALVEGNQLSMDAAESLLQRMVQLANSFKSGEISAAEFTNGTLKLRAAMDQAVIAEKKKQQQELLAAKKRLLTGKGTDADRDMLKKQIEAAREAALTSQINQQFEQMINNMAGANGGLQNFTEGVQRFQRNLPAAGGDGASLGGGGGGNAPSVGEASGMLNQFMNSTGGRIQTVLNQIQLAQQSLGLTQQSADSFMSFGFGDKGYRFEKRIRDQLTGLFQELNSLLYSPPPLFDQMLLGQAENIIGFDPGLQSQNSQGQTINVTVQPNSMDGRQLLESINGELQAGGHQRFF